MPRTRTQPAITDDAWEALKIELVLSPREVQIAQAILQDQKELAIAQKLGISHHTVHTHLERLYRKLRVNSRIELVVRLVEFANTLRCSIDTKLGPLCSRRTTPGCPFGIKKEDRKNS